MYIQAQHQPSSNPVEAFLGRRRGRDGPGGSREGCLQGWKKEEEGDGEEAVSSPIPAELLVPARPAQLPQAGPGNCLAGCDLTAHVCPACSQTSQHHLLCPCLHFLSLPPHHLFLLCLSPPSLSKVGLEMEKPSGKLSRSPSGNQLTPHFRPKLLGSLPVAETPPTVPGAAWPDGGSFPADEGLGPGERMGSGHPCRRWAGALGTVGGGPGHVVKTGWGQEGGGDGTVGGGQPHLRFRVVSRLPLTEAGTSV